MDKIVVKMCGYATHYKMFERRWMGKHIDEVRKEVGQLYKHVIHSMRWADPQIQKKVERFQDLRRACDSLRLSYHSYTPEMEKLYSKEYLRGEYEVRAKELKLAADWLNVERAKDFGYNWATEPRYFDVVPFDISQP